jgi:Guanylate kinase
VLNTLPNLRTLKLKRNPLSQLPASNWVPLNGSNNANAQYLPSYRLRTIFIIQKLTVFDSLPVIYKEKISAVNTYAPPSHVVLSTKHVSAQKNLVKAYAKIKAHDLLNERKLRPLVLYGPAGSGKRTLTRRLLDQYPHLYGVSVSHTTRKPRFGEENGVHYHFITSAEMDRMTEEGKFISVVSLFGNKYGTSIESIDKVTEEGKVCVLDLEIEVGYF